MKRVLVLSMLSMAVITAGCTKKGKQPEVAKSSATNQVLIEVNGHKLTNAEAERQVEKRLGGPPPADFTKERIKKVRDLTLSKVVDQFVKKTLLLEEADKLKITATKEEVDKAVKDIRDKEAAALKASTNSVAQASAASDDQLREEVTTGIRIDKLLAIKIPTLKPTDKQIDEFIAKHKKALTDPKTGQLIQREKVIKLMQDTRRHLALTEYLRVLQSKAEIKHAPNVIPPKYTEKP